MKRLLCVFFLALCGLCLYAEIPGKGSALEVYGGIPVFFGRMAVDWSSGGEILEPGLGIKAGIGYLNFPRVEWDRLGFGVFAGFYIPFDARHLDEDRVVKETYKTGSGGDVLGGFDITIGAARRFLSVNNGVLVGTAFMGLRVNYLGFQTDQGAFSASINRINFGIGTFFNTEWHFSRYCYLLVKLSANIDLLGLYAGEKLTTTTSITWKTAYYVDKKNYFGPAFAATMNIFLGLGFPL